MSKYAHLSKAFITVEQLRWQRIPISQGAGQTPKPHSHAFYRDGNEKRTVQVEVRFCPLELHVPHPQCAQADRLVTASLSSPPFPLLAYVHRLTPQPGETSSSRASHLAFKTCS